MSTIREIKRRIKSAKNIGQVTRALQMVSAVKMKKAQASSLSGQPYADQLKEALLTLTGTDELTHPYLLQPKSMDRILLVSVGPQKGLAGSLISNLARRLFQFKSARKGRITGISFGKKGSYLLMKAGIDIIADFANSKDRTLSDQISALSSLIDTEFMAGHYDVVYILYSRFVNTITQVPEILQLLPTISLEPDETRRQQFIFEPSTDRLLDLLLEHYLTTTIRQIILDSQAAEHSARMIAMKNASENAADIVTDLSLTYNKIRQSTVTAEISDIISGSLSSPNS